MLLERISTLYMQVQKNISFKHAYKKSMNSTTQKHNDNIYKSRSGLVMFGVIKGHK